MANKLRREHGQPGISGYLKSDDDLMQNKSPKKRTLPSIEKNLSKKLQVKANSEIPIMSLNNKDTLDQEHDSIDTADDDPVSEEETAFERRLTRSLSRLMRKELRSVRQYVKALRSDQEQNTKSLNDLASVKEENIILKRECECVLDENRTLKGKDHSDRKHLTRQQPITSWHI